MIRTARLQLVAIVNLVLLAHPLAAQERGVAAVSELERTLGVRTRALMIAAHPDDEYTPLLAWLARGRGVTTAYLSLTRGDGGQNLVGNELGEALGIVRTQELLAARRIDRAHQYFTRAYDFGFSKNAEETFEHWPRDSILGDMVKVVRSFRPHIIISVFSGTRRDGHGQHEVAGLLSREVFDAAGDTTRFPTGTYGAAWLPLKFYHSAWRNQEAATVRINVGEYNPMLGRSYLEISGESRSQHKSQGFGTLQRKGVSWAHLTRGASRVGPQDPKQERSLFDGLDTTRVITDSARSELALLRAHVAVEAVAARAEVASGDSVPVTVTVYNRGGAPISVTPIRFGPGGSVSILPDSAVALRGWWRGTKIDQPWWLVAPRVGALFSSTGVQVAEDEREKEGWIALSVIPGGASTPAVVRVPVVYRYQDPVRGDVQIPVVTVPGVTLSLDGHAAYARAGAPVARAVTASVRSAFPDTVTAIVSLDTDPGLTVDTARRTVVLPPGGVRTVRFVVSARSLSAGAYRASMRATVEDRTFNLGYQSIEYEHITPQRLYYAADLTLNVIDVNLPPRLKVGYIAGVGDNVFGVLDQLDVELTLISPVSIPTANLSVFNTIVVGPRAYEANPELVAHNDRLLEYVHKGGRLVVQYGQYEMATPGMMPYPITLNRPHTRVTEEDAPVTVLAPASSLLRAPNRITTDDFRGWVQERSLYMPKTFDPRYKTLLSMHDPNEPPNDGAVLIAPYGKGTYVYTTLAFFRQLPAAVPGATRLFINLLAPQNR